MVGQPRLPAELEVWMAARAASPPASPDTSPLLGDPDEDNAEAALALGLLEGGRATSSFDSRLPKWTTGTSRSLANRSIARL